ncbi:amidoligase family protein [Shimia ponticola]|uniref:amidoligase family protein n=1 Tax=Shimia ponticola TaxID=2582893 RepID=UPI0011BE027E|nr:amidoligase family protein [Shimia ponticola]
MIDLATPASRTKSLPRHTSERGGTAGALLPQKSERQLGVEVEFAGLTEAEAATKFAAALETSAREDGDMWVCQTRDFGKCVFYLDTAYKSKIEQVGGAKALTVARTVVPVELVTDPFDPAALPTLNSALAKLRDAGALGSRHALMYGFGVHLNVAIADASVEHIYAVTCAFALLEEALRSDIDLDIARRALPFIDPYPDSLIEALVGGRPETMDGFACLLLSKTSSRNHGLDLLPILAELSADVTAEYVSDDTKLSPRPAYHYRLPECRIDEPGWDLSKDWARWCAVEALAASDELDTLIHARREWQTQPALTRRAWRDVSRPYLIKYLEGHHTT